MQAVLFHYDGMADVKFNHARWMNFKIEVNVYQDKIECFNGDIKYRDGDFSWKVIIERPIYLGFPKFIKSKAKMLKKYISIRLPSKEVLKGDVYISKAVLDDNKIKIHADGIGGLNIYK